MAILLNRVFLNVILSSPAVAVEGAVGDGFLEVVGVYDTLANGGAALALLHLGELREWHHWHFNMQVYPIEQGTTDLREVTADLSWGTDTMVCRIPVIATGAGVHGGHKHERTRVFHRITGTADGYLTVFQRLAQYLQGGLVKLWQLIQEKHPIMG